MEDHLELCEIKIPDYSELFLCAILDDETVFINRLFGESYILYRDC